jgi:hypothetical protein
MNQENRGIVLRCDRYLRLSIRFRSFFVVRLPSTVRTRRTMAFRHIRSNVPPWNRSASSVYSLVAIIWGMTDI